MKPVIFLNSDPFRRIPDSEIHQPLDNLWNEFRENKLKNLQRIFEVTIEKIHSIDPALSPLLSEDEVKSFNTAIAAEIKKLLENLFPLLKDDRDFLQNSRTLINDITRRTVGGVENILAIQDYCLSVFRNFFEQAKGNFSSQSAEESAQIVYENLSGLEDDSCMGGNSSSSEDISRKRRTSQLSLFEEIKDALVIPLFDNLCKKGNQVHVNSLINWLFGDEKATTRDQSTIFAATLNISIPELHQIVKKIVLERFDLICEYLSAEYEKTFLMPGDFDQNLELVLFEQSNDLLKKLCQGENPIDHNKICAEKNPSKRSQLIREEIARKLIEENHKVINGENELELLDYLCLCTSYVLKNKEIPVWLQRRIWQQKEVMEIWAKVKNRKTVQDEFNHENLKVFINTYVTRLDDAYKINLKILKEAKYRPIPTRTASSLDYVRACFSSGEDFSMVSDRDFTKALAEINQSGQLLNFDLSGIVFHPHQELFLKKFYNFVKLARNNGEEIAKKIVVAHQEKHNLSDDFVLLNFNGFLLNLFAVESSAEYFKKLTSGEFASALSSVFSFIDMVSRPETDVGPILQEAALDSLYPNIFATLRNECHLDENPFVKNVFQAICHNSINPLSLSNSLKEILQDKKDILLTDKYYSLLSENIDFISSNFENKNDKRLDSFIRDLIDDKSYLEIPIPRESLKKPVHQRKIDRIESCKRAIVEHCANAGNDFAKNKISEMLGSPSVSTNAQNANGLLPDGSRGVQLGGDDS